MKVLYILSSTNATAGSSKSFLRLLQQLLSKGIESWVVIPGTDGIYSDLKRMPVHTIVLPVRSSAYPDTRNLFYRVSIVPRFLYWRTLNLYTQYKLKKIIQREKIDIIHSNVSILGVGYKVAKTMLIPHVYHIREYGDKDFNIHYFPTKEMYMKRMFASNSYNICITRDIQKHHHLEHCCNSQVIYNGIASKDDIRIQNKKEKFFLYAGRIERAKGLLELLEAYHTYAKKVPTPIPLKVAGKINDQKYYQQIVEYIKKNLLSNLVEFLGEKKDISNLLCSTTALIIPSLFEGFGRCMAEAMFNDCLVIGKNTGGTKEQFDNGEKETGEDIGFRYDTIEELAAILGKVSNEPAEHFLHYRQRARQTVSKLYTCEMCAMRVFELYQEIVYHNNKLVGAPAKITKRQD